MKFFKKYRLQLFDILVMWLLAGLGWIATILLGISLYFLPLPPTPTALGAAQIIIGFGLFIFVPMVTFMFWAEVSDLAREYIERLP